MVDANETVVQTVKLTKVFRDFWLREKVTAVSELDMEVYPGEVFGLLGPNGSGKSTTLKMILGLLFPTRGRIAVFGRRPNNVKIKSRIGFLPEESYLYPFLDAHETLDFYGRLFHQPRQRRRRRTEMLLEMVGLSGVAYRRVGEYSKGMQRRIGLAQALINDPDLLILDEPTAGMDPIGTKQFKDLIRLLAERGKSVILSSHLLADVEDVCERVCILYGGRERARGTIEDLLEVRSSTQITTEGLDESALAKVTKAIRSAGRKVLEVTAPRDKLESLFLRIVDEAQAQRLTTGGATSGGEVAEFLMSGSDVEGKQVIDRLIAKPIEDQPAPASEPAHTESEPAQEVIEQLTTPAVEKPEQKAGPVSDKPAPKVDRSVLDNLMGGSADSEE